MQRALYFLAGMYFLEIYRISNFNQQFEAQKNHCLQNARLSLGADG